MSPRSRRDAVIDSIKALAASSSRAEKSGAFLTTSMSTPHILPEWVLEISLPSRRLVLEGVCLFKTRDSGRVDPSCPQDLSDAGRALSRCPVRTRLRGPVAVVGGHGDVRSDHRCPGEHGDPGGLCPLQDCRG